MQIHYIGHSGFSVTLDSAVLLFDYFHGDMGALAADRPLFVFASHAHRDHFNFDIFKKTAAHPNVHYILSSDIKHKFNRKRFLLHGISEACYDERVHFISANAELSLPPVRVETIGSTDCGVAFIVSVFDKTIFHAGDLNLWLWKGDTEVEQVEMTRLFFSELCKVEGRTFDLAFFPLDPRQEGGFPFGGIDAFMRATDTKKIVPMHCWDDLSIIDRLLKDPRSTPYRSRLYAPQRQQEQS